jgi:hypothetical protein
MTLVHFTGPYEDGVQRCAYCDVVLVDHRNSVVRDGDPAPKGFPNAVRVGVNRASLRQSSTKRRRKRSELTGNAKFVLLADAPLIRGLEELCTIPS